MGYQAIDSLFYVEDYAVLCQTRINRTAVRIAYKNKSNRGTVSPAKNKSNRNSASPAGKRTIGVRLTRLTNSDILYSNQFRR